MRPQRKRGEGGGRERRPWATTVLKKGGKKRIGEAKNQRFPFHSIIRKEGARRCNRLKNQRGRKGRKSSCSIFVQQGKKKKKKKKENRV